MQPNADSHYAKQCLISYLLFKACEESLPCSIGCRILKAKLFDDVFCKFHRQDKSWIYLFDVKSHRYKNRRITVSDLEGTSSKLDFDLQRYFRAYLQLRNLVDAPIRELAVWTRTEFDRKDCSSSSILLDYTSPKDAVDLFGTTDFGIQRYRVRHLAVIAEALLRSCDPLYKLATSLTRLMFNKLSINTKTIPKNLYHALLRDVFEDRRFRKEFVQDSDTLCPEVKQLHKFLVTILGQQFLQRNITGFSQLTQIEQKPFAEFVELRIESCEPDSTNRDTSWKIDHAVIQADVEEFFSLLVFYTNVPVKEDFRAIVQKYCDQTMQDVLGKIYQRGVLLQNEHEEAILELMSLKRLEKTKVLTGPWFEPESLIGLRNMLLNFRSQSFCNTLVIVSCGDLDVSASRMGSVLRELSCNYLFISSKEFLEKRSKLLHIMQVLELSDQWILVISTGDSSIIGIVSEIDYLTIIVIVPEAYSPPNADLLIYKDQFNFDDLPDGIKDRIESTSVLLQGRHFYLNALLSEAALSMIPVSALLDWYRNRDEIVIGCERDELCEDLFIPRYLQSENNSIVDPFQTSFESISVLSGLPGTGKTSLLSAMAASFQRRFDDHIVIFEDTKRVVDWFGLKINAIDLIAKLINVQLAEGFQKFVLQKLVDDRRVILLLDGFDEISQTKQESTLEMLQWIQCANLKTVIIATRPHRVLFLKDCFNNPAVYSMAPFTEEDQLCFFQYHFSTVSPNDILDRIRSFRAAFDDIDALQIPLQCSILATIYGEQIDNHSLKLSNVADVFQRFIDKTFELYACKFFDLFNRAHEAALDSLRSSFVSDHSELAFRMDTHQYVEKERFENLEQYGLLRIDEGIVSFIHSSLKEFFNALYLVSRYVDQEHFNLFLMERFCKPTVNRFDMFLEHHICNATGRWKPEGTPPSMLSLNLGEFRKQRIYRLHVNKIKQFHVFLVECCSVEKQIEYVRSSIAKGHFGIFETIYQSLPMSLFQVIRFKFQPNTDDPFTVNLSTISKLNLLELLTILHRQHPLGIVEKIIASYNTDEDDFITTAIIHNYGDVIQHISSIEQNLNSEDESDLLLEYVYRRLQQYLTLTIEYGRDELLARTFDLIGKRFHPRVIKHFLMNQSLQQVLLESCKSDAASAIVIQRVVGFIEKHLSDTDLKVLLKRKNEGEASFGETLMKLRNREVRAVCEAFWERYGNF